MFKGKATESATIDAVRPKPRFKQLQQQNNKCGNCGLQEHRGTICPARGKHCVKCKNMNHHIRVCQSSVNAVNELVDDVADEASDSLMIETIDSNCSDIPANAVTKLDIL